MNRSTLFVCAALSALVFAACDDSTSPEGGAQIRTELIRLEGTTPAVTDMFPSPAATPEPGSFPWSSDIEIESFETPIRAIWLENDAEASESLVYECLEDSNDGCLVDLAGPALQDLLGAGSVTIREGEYTRVVVSTCEEEGQYTGYLRGSLDVAGGQYMTHTDSVLSESSTAEAVALTFSGCQRSYPIAEPVVVTDTLGEAINLRLYFDIRDLAWASLGTAETSDGWIPGGCAGPSPDGIDVAPFLCVAYPDVAAVVDDQTPVIERYRINGGATVGLIFQATGGAFVGGFSRRYFQDGVFAPPGFTADTPVEEFSDNGDGTFRLTTFGTSGEGGGPVGHYLTIEAFVRDTHSGMALDFGGNSFAYTATRIE